MPSLGKTNNILLALIIFINSYLILAPLYPKAYLWWQLRIGHRQEQLEKVVHEASSKPSKKSTVRQGEWLVIPKIAIDTQVFEGPTIATANKGIWHRPKTSSPDKNSNTVLVGHRFTYTQPKGIFYNLDKLAIGDEMALFWNGKAYKYKVSDVKVVPPDDVHVEDPSDDAKLTLYTCTPLWSAKNRLVITALRSDQ